MPMRMMRRNNSSSTKSTIASMAANGADSPKSPFGRLVRRARSAVAHAYPTRNFAKSAASSAGRVQCIMCPAPSSSARSRLANAERRSSSSGT